MFGTSGSTSDTEATAMPQGLRFLPDPAGKGFNAWLYHLDMSASTPSGNMVVRGPLAAPQWETRTTVLAHGRSEARKLPWSGTVNSAEGSTVRWHGAAMDVEYVLTFDGLRQNFIVTTPPEGRGALEIDLGLSTPLCPEQEGSTGILFRDVNGAVRHAYRGLLVWDACGNILDASIRVDASKNMLVIAVDDTDAEYPITVDPISTTANRVLNAPSGGLFGWSVASAGDVNGDGYSDVAVGAYTAPGGGRVFVYHGTATGIPAAPTLTLTSGRPDSNYGYSIDGAGDVNNDGYSDLVVGATIWDNNAATPQEGAAFIYHGSATGLDPVPAVILQPNASANFMGYSVAGLGDINGDGFSDVGVGGFLASYGQFNEGVTWIFLGSATGLDPVFRHRLERNQGGAQFGCSVSAAGDVNGDGFNDVIIGAHKYNLFTAPAGPPDDGAVFIYHGSVNALGSGLSPVPALTFNSVGTSTRTGWSVSTAGDVNGDGYSDVIIGDWQDEIGPENDEGVALIYHGSPTGIIPTPVTVIQGNQTDAWLGRSLSSAGDVNGDGYGDVIIGAGQYTNGQAKEGAVFLHLGSPTGVSSSPFLRFESNQINGYMGESISMAGDVNGDGYSDMIFGIYGLTGGGGAHIYHGGTYSSNTTASFTRSSGLAQARLGAAVANAGDINGDGYSDAIFGAPEATNGQANEGLAYVHYGSPTGLSPLPSLTLEANIAGADYGASVASAGDVNGDGYADVVIGAPQSGGTGRAYVHHGGPGGLVIAPALVLTGTPGSRFGASVFKAGDFNADGYSDLVVGAPGSETVHVFEGSPTGLVPVPFAILTAPVPGSAFGSAVGTAGDVNGDGFSDIIVGAPEQSGGQALAGAVYIYHGTLFELVDVPSTTIDFNVAGRRMGTSVAGAGDMNGDGFSDIVFGAPFATFGQANEGIIYVARGSPSGVTLAGLASFQSDQVDANIGTSVAEAGDVNGDGYADIIVGAPNFSNGETGEGRAWVILGAPAGLGTNTVLETNVAGDLFGSSVAGGGDVDGDGYSDVIGGAPGGAPSLANEGTVRLFRGNNALSLGRITRQYQTDLISPLATNSADFADELFFGIGHHARSPIQRTRARLQWEVVHEGQPFSGAPITNSVASTAQSAAWTDLGLTGFQIKELVDKAPNFYRYKWRVRVEYPMHKMIDGQRFSRWFYGYASGVGDIGVLPVELMGLHGVPLATGNLIDWITASETGSSRFIVERSPDGLEFGQVGSVNAMGESNVPTAYEFMDPMAPDGLSYYRLRMVDINDDEAFSPVIAVVRECSEVVIYPVPVEDLINWTPTTDQTARAIVRDALGRTLIDVLTTGSTLQGAYVQRLATGTYTLVLLDNKGEIISRSRFVKR